jgi:hypothetical protein
MYFPRSIPLPAGAEQKDASTFSNACATGLNRGLNAKSSKQIRQDGKMNGINAQGYFVGSCIVLCAACSIPVRQNRTRLQKARILASHMTIGRRRRANASACFDLATLIRQSSYPTNI